MKKIYYFILASAVSVALNSCTNDDIVGGENNGTEKGLSEAIMFGSGFKVYTRAEKLGADAANLLNKRFIVSGFKTSNNSTYTTVFKDYAVVWNENTAGKTESNTTDWEYVGVTPLSPATTVTAQTVKYWDYSTSSYDFIAYSTGTATETKNSPTAGEVQVTAIDHANLATGAYSLTGAKDDLAKCYIADMVTVNKASYGNEVEIKFHSLTSKVRIGFYETVPGYRVKNVKFYNAHPTTLGTGSTTTAALIGAFKNSGTFKVLFTGKKAGVSLETGGTDATYATFGTFPSDAIGVTSSAATYAGSGYQQVIPTSNAGSLELAVDYTLESEDGSGEVINIYGATAFVPAAYTKWNPNFAYTFIFKISDNTNGWTSTVTTDPSGLFPITFDAVVAETEEGGSQATITTVATPSITTYQKGHDTTKDEYSASATTPDIYIQVMTGNPVALATDLATNGKLYKVTGSTPISEATVMDALHITESTGVGRNGLTLTETTNTDPDKVDATIAAIPGEDGNNIAVTPGTAAKFTPSAPTNPATVNSYAYVYDTQTWDGVKVHLSTTPTDFTTNYYTDPACTTLATGEVPAAGGDYYQRVSYIYTAVALTAQPSDWSTSGVWYTDPNGTTPVGTYADGTYYKKYTVDHKIYGVKVIKVVD